MTVESTPAVVAAVRIREALEEIGAALARPQLDRLLACEGALEQAMAAVPTIADLASTDHAVVRSEIERAQAALMRCRRLGAAFEELISLSIQAQGGCGYGPRHAVTDGYAGRGLDTRA